MERTRAGTLIAVGVIALGSCDRPPVPLAPSFEVTTEYPSVVIDAAPGYEIVTSACRDYTATVRDINGNPLTNPYVIWHIGDTRVARITNDNNNNNGADWTGQGPVHVCGQTQPSQGYGYTDLTATWASPAGPPYPSHTIPIEYAQTDSGYQPLYLYVSPSSADLVVQQTVGLTAEGRDQFNHTRGEQPVWSSSNTNVATVGSSSGIVTAVALGSATITANALGTTVDVPVFVRGPTSITVAPIRQSVCLGGGATLTATVRDNANDVWTAGIVSWSSGNTSVVTVTPGSGGARLATVGGVAYGETPVTATFQGMSASSTVKTISCSPHADVTGPYTMNMYTYGRFTATGSLGTPPYTYEFSRRDCDVNEYNCQPWSNWVARGSTNYWDTIVYGCGIQHIYVQSRVTDSNGYVSAPSGSWRTAINNPC